MRMEIKGLKEMQERLARVQVAEVMASALTDGAERLAQAVRDNLSDSPGSGGHERPWAQTGALRDSIAATATGLEASVGSNDPAAAPQEMGTSRMQPRPFLAPAASSMAESIAQSVGEAVAGALKGEREPASSPSPSGRGSG